MKRLASEVIYIGVERMYNPDVEFLREVVTISPEELKAARYPGALLYHAVTRCRMELDRREKAEKEGAQ